MIFSLILLACGPIDDGEVRVLPGDLPVDLTVGEPLGWGQAVVEVEGVVWAASESEGLVLSAQGEEVRGPWAGRGIWLGTLRGELLIGVAGLGLFDQEGALLFEGRGSRAFASNGEEWVMAEEELVRHSDGRVWTVSDPRAVAMQQGRVAVLSCTGGESCLVLELGDEIADVGLGEAGGDLAFFEDTLWWGLPELSNPNGMGRVASEWGEEIVGRVGDHLGRSIGAGYAAGSMNGQQVPRVLRLEPLQGGDVFAIDRSSGSYTVALAGDEERLLMGIPGWADAGGAVMVVDVEKAP